MLNNLAVGLANQGQVEAAMEAFGEIRDAPDELRPTLFATEGLLSFRRGDAVEGRRRYLEAVERARRQGNRRTEALAIVHLAREELIAETTMAGETLAAAEAVCVGVDAAEILHMLKVVSGLRNHPA